MKNLEEQKVLKASKGECSYDINANNGFDVFMKNTLKTIGKVLFKDVSYMPNQEEAEANAILFTDAVNVFNETGKTPRQLAATNKELVDLLNEVKNNLEKSNTTGNTIYHKTVLLIKKATL